MAALKMFFCSISFLKLRCLLSSLLLSIGLKKKNRSAAIKVVSTHGRQSWEGWGENIPPGFGKGGMVNAVIPPWKWMKLWHILSELPYLSACKSSIKTVFFDGLSLIFVIQLVEFIVNLWNKHDCFPNCSHIQVIYSACWLVTSTTHKELLLYLPYTSYIRASNISCVL